MYGMVYRMMVSFKCFEVRLLYFSLKPYILASFKFDVVSVIRNSLANALINIGTR